MNIKTSDLVLAENITTLCTDFFDTLVSRRCHPEEIKKKWCAEISSYFSLNVECEELYKLRLQCEAEICSVNVAKYGEAEFRYEEMVLLFFQQINLKYGCNIACESVYTVAESLELALERRYQFLNDDEVSFVRSQKNKGIRVVLISDFYMSACFIEELCNYHGIASLIDSYYVSSEQMKTKRTGCLYRAVLDTEKLSPRECFMIGDNVTSDVHNARNLSMYAHHIQRDFRDYDRSLSRSNSGKWLKQQYKFLLEKNEFEFSWMAIPLYLFIRKLFFKLKSGGVGSVAFLAREGEFLKQLFDEYLKLRNEENIRSSYLIASRRGTYLPSLRKLEEENFHKLFMQYPKQSVVTFLNNLGLEQHLSVLVEEIPCDKRDIVYCNFPLSDEYAILRSSSLFKEVYEQERGLAKQYLNDYLNYKIGRDTEIHVVDVGWRGSIQDNLQAATGRSMVGYYCGVLSGASIASDNVKYGLLFRELRPSVLKASVFNEFRAAYEVLCSASHGSLRKYAPAPCYVDLEDNLEESYFYENQIEPIQRKIKDVVFALYRQEQEHACGDFELSEVLTPFFEKSVFFPSAREMSLFSQFKHYENFGQLDFSSFDVSLKNRAAYLGAMIKDPLYNVGKEWWKPLGFTLNGCSILKYPYYLVRKAKMREVQE